MTNFPDALPPATQMPSFGSFNDALRTERGDESARRAALVIHALPVGDRDWILRQLPLESRERLSELLGELIQLEIPAAASLLQEVRFSQSAPPEADLKATPSAVAARDLMQSDPALIAAALEDEPVFLVARLLKQQEWPWTSHVLECLSLARRRQIQEKLASSPARRQADDAHGVLDERLLALLRERLRYVADTTQAHMAIKEHIPLRQRSIKKLWRPMRWLNQFGLGNHADGEALSKEMKR